MIDPTRYRRWLTSRSIRLSLTTLISLGTTAFAQESHYFDVTGSETMGEATAPLTLVEMAYYQ